MQAEHVGLFIVSSVKQVYKANEAHAANTTKLKELCCGGLRNVETNRIRNALLPRLLPFAAVVYSVFGARVLCYKYGVEVKLELDDEMTTLNLYKLLSSLEPCFQFSKTANS